MNLYEWEGKQLFIKHGIAVPRGVVVRRGEDPSTSSPRGDSVEPGQAAKKVYEDLGVKDVVVKAQVLSGKRGKNNGIKFCSSAKEVEATVREMFDTQIRGQYVAAVLIEEKLDILEEQYVSIVYDTNRKQPMLVYSCAGGMDIEDVADHKIKKFPLDIREEKIDIDVPYAQELWNCFRAEDTRQVEINPLVKTMDGRFVAADAKVAIDDDAFYRHGSTSSPQASGLEVTDGSVSSPQDWTKFEPRTMLGRLPTERELAVKKIDEGDAYYRGTAGKYIEMDGDIAILFSGGGASIANMDALIKCGLKPANYTEYSGNPPREKVAALAKIVLSKPGLRGLWIAGGVANFTNIADTFAGIVDAIDEVKPIYPIVVRRAGPSEEEGMRIMQECAERNNLHIKLFGKEMSMSDSAKALAEMVAGDKR